MLTLTQTRMGHGSFVFYRIGIIVLATSVSHFLEMTMLISYPDSNKNGGRCFLYFQYYYFG